MPASDLEFVRRVYRLLGSPPFAARQFKATRDKFVGKWVYASVRSISPSDVYAHVRGKSTLAISPIARYDGIDLTFAIFLCLDIDEHFVERLPIVRAILADRGLARASFAATGSDAGRGKIVVALERPIPQGDAVMLVRGIVADAQRDLLWGAESTITSTYPTGGQGGIVRILGRNLARTESDHLDLPLGLDGLASDLTEVVPVLLPGALSALIPPNPIRIDGGKRYGDTARSKSGTTPTARQAEELRANPYSGGGQLIWTDMLTLARAAIMACGRGSNGRATFETWVDELLLQIPANKTGALRQARDKSTRDRAFRGTINFLKVDASNRPDLLGAWQPLNQNYFVPFAKFQKTGGAAWRAYESLAAYVFAKRIDPHALSIGYRQLSTLCGYSNDDRTAVRYAVDAAERSGLLFRIHRGDQYLGGRCTLIALVGRDETPQLAIDLGIASTEYQKRLKADQQNGVVVPIRKIADGGPVFPARKAA